MCQCYFWQRKIFSFLFGIGSFVLAWFITIDLAKGDEMITLLISLSSGLLLGNLMFVLWSETYCERHRVFSVWYLNCYFIGYFKKTSEIELIWRDLIFEWRSYQFLFLFLNWRYQLKKLVYQHVWREVGGI